MNSRNISYNKNRLIEDTIGATIGAATGAGISTFIALATPVIASIVPIGLIAGSVAGVVFKELALRKQRLNNPDADIALTNLRNRSRESISNKSMITSRRLGVVFKELALRKQQLDNPDADIALTTLRKRTRESISNKSKSTAHRGANIALSTTLRNKRKNALRNISARVKTIAAGGDVITNKGGMIAKIKGKNHTYAVIKLDGFGDNSFYVISNDGVSHGAFHDQRRAVKAAYERAEDDADKLF